MAATGDTEHEGAKPVDELDADAVDETFVAAPRPDVVSIELDGEMVLIDGGQLSVRHLDAVGTVGGSASTARARCPS